MKSEHTPTPWKTYYDDGPTSPFPGWKIKADDVIESPVGLIPETIGGTKDSQGRSPRQKANAAFIVQACNAHEALISAVKFIASQKDKDGNWAVKIAQEVLKLAEGREP